MSQQEFDQQDEQAMRIANRKSEPKEGALLNQVSDTDVAELRRRILWTTIQILSCILAAALFVAALMDQAFVVFLVNAGVLVCGMTVAVLVDRAIRFWRKR